MENVIPNKVIQQQEKVKGFSALENTEPSIVNENEVLEVLNEITENNIEANIIERPYNGEAEIEGTSLLLIMKAQ